MILNLSKRHPEVDRPLVDWSLIVIMQPLTLAGAIIGTYLGRIFPDWILVICLVILLGYTAVKTASLEASSKTLIADIIRDDEEQNEQSRLLPGEEDEDDPKPPSTMMITKNPIDNPHYQTEKGAEVVDEVCDKLDEAAAMSSSSSLGLESLERHRQEITESERSTPLKKVFLVSVMFGWTIGYPSTYKSSF